jgi:hypothetical protein
MYIVLADAIRLIKATVSQELESRNQAQTIAIEKLCFREGLFYFILKGHHHDRSLKPVSASSHIWIGFVWTN